MVAWIYEVMIDEFTKPETSRREVRDHVDAELLRIGEEMIAVSRGIDPEQARREIAVNDPSNEQGAAALMAIAGGGRP